MKNKRGVSIYIAIFCLLLFSSLAFIISSLVATHTETATNYLASEQALHIAEAGVQYSVWYLINKDQNWITSGTSEKTLGSGTYTLKVDYDEIEEKRVVISTGYVPNGTNPRAKREVKLEGTFGVVEGSHPIYGYSINGEEVHPAIYTDNRYSPDWPVDNLIGLRLNPNTGQSTYFSIIGNTENTITTAGNMTTVATTGDPYSIYAQGASTNLTATVLADNSASWTEDIFKGKDLNPNTTQEETFTITENTATTITVLGDMTEVAATGDTYKIIYDSGISANLIATQLTDTITLIFDASKYNLSTRRLNDGDADVFSNNDIFFKNGSGWVVDGHVYSAGKITKENWTTGDPWRRQPKYEDQDSICPPYLDDAARDYYRERAIAQGNYYPGDKTFTGLVELGSPWGTPALIYVEGKVKIGNVKYHRPGNTGRYGVGTIVSGGGDMTITGAIEPASGDRCKLALASFYDTKYKYEIVEPPYTEGNRKLDIQDGDGESELKFDNESITITYRRGDWRERYGWLTVWDYNSDPDNPLMDVYIGTPSGGIFSYTFDTSTLLADDWYYFRVQTCRRSNRTQLRSQIYAYFIEGNPSEPQHSIRCYEDSGFTEETSGFENGGTVYLEIYANDPSTTTINTLQIGNYTLTTYNRTPIYDTPATNYIRCHFTLPSNLTEGWWYNLYVVTDEPGYFAKQIYIKSAPDIYACIHSNGFFRLDEDTDLNIYGNLTAKQGFKITPPSPISRIRVTYDAEIFRSPRWWQTNPYALPGSVSFEYTWKED